MTRAGVRRPESARSERPVRRRVRTQLLPQLLASVVESRPNAVAVSGLQNLTYAELDAQSSHVAWILIERGIGPGDVVAVSGTDDVAFWGVIKSGAGVRVDGNAIHSASRELLDEGSDMTAHGSITYSDRVRPLRAEHEIFVSDAVVTHECLIALTALSEALGLSAESRLFAPDADNGVLTSILASLSGGSVVRGDSTDATHILGTVDALRSLELGPARASVILVGPIVEPDVVAKWSNAGCQVRSLYAPAGASWLGTTGAALIPGGPVSLGSGLVTALALDPRLRPVSIDEAGELYLAGPGVARSVGNTAETVARLVAGPDGTRMFRTGVQVRINRHGLFEPVDGPMPGLVADSPSLLSDFERQVERTPDAVALVAEGQSLTYREFADRVFTLSRHLIDLGVGPEARVGLAMRRGIDLMVGMYATVSAGGAWVPVDPDHPAERIDYIIETAQPVCVLTNSADSFATQVAPVVVIDAVDLSGYATSTVTDADRIGALRPENIAYVIFTSGSTGRPKGVAVSHAAVINQMRWMNAEYGLTGADVYLQKTATTFDVSLWGFWMPLMVGAKLVLCSPDGHKDPQYVSAMVAEHQATITDFVPSMLSVFIGAAKREELTTLRHVFVIGEALPAATAQDWFGISDAGLHNLYGPTEAAVSVTYWQAGEGDTVAVPIGVPEWNVRCYVLDGRLNPTPAGIPGELYLAGIQVARGYLTRPDLTSDRFIADPFGGDGARLYRTGDLVKRRPDGTLDYIGRTDFQVKLRGQRIELGEIEADMLNDPAVSQAAAIVRESQAGQQQLVGYVVPVPGASIDIANLKQLLAEKLPAYMLPEAYVVMDAFPLNTSGKLDRKALPAPELHTTEFRVPSGLVEETIATVFSHILNIEQIGADDDFFDLGGNSLLATQVAARVGATLDMRIAPRVVFESSTVAQLAAAIKDHVGEGGHKQLKPQPRPERIPLSLAQSRMWFLNRFDPASAVYNIPLAIRLTGKLDTEALQAAVADVIDRHEVLRTVYPEYDGVPYQQILIEAALELTPVPTTRDTVLQQATELVTTGFDVTAEVPIRVQLLTLTDAADEYVLVVVVHHIAGDGYSVGPLARDLMTAYASRANGQMPGWQPLEVQYADYSLWQRDVLGDSTDPQSLIAQQEKHWLSVLAGLPEVITLPTDRPRPATASYRGATTTTIFEATLVERLTALGYSHQASLFMTVHAAVAVLLARLSGTTDIAVGTPIAGRDEEALDNLVGMFVNTLVLRTQVDLSASFEAVLAEACEVDITAFENADVPFERLVESLNPVRSQSHAPLFQVALVFQNIPGQTTFELPGLTVAGVDIDAVPAKYDLQITVTELADHRLAAEFTYATDLFDEATVRGFSRRLERIFEAVVDDPTVVVGDIDILDPAETSRLTQVDSERHPPVLLPELLARAAAAQDTVAVVDGERSITYAELDAESNRLARVLIERGIGTEDVVAVALGRSYEIVLAWWAIAKTGAAFVNIDPAHPHDRIRFMLDDAGVRIGLTLSSVQQNLPEGADWLALDDLDTASMQNTAITERLRPVRLSNTAYSVYTSGSTGRPKGIETPHTGLANLIASQREIAGLQQDSRVLLLVSPSFDASVYEWLLAVGAGCTLVIAPPDVYAGDPLAELIRANQVTHAVITPAVLRTVPTAAVDCLQWVLSAGEAINDDLVARWSGTDSAGTRRLFNGYGPAEATTQSNWSELRPGHRVEIGPPLVGFRDYVLDSRLRPVPIGVAGELYIGGPGVGRAYRSRPDLTCARFIGDPFGGFGERLYRTGDVVRWVADGDSLSLEYVGRSDFQVKVRGQRIELGEIDSALLAHPAVESAITVGHRNDSGQTELASYFVGNTIAVEELRAFLSERLPRHMVPTSLVLLDAMPLTPVGKIDRKALPAPTVEVRSFRAPASEMERAIAEVFAEVLGASRVGADDDFFALGGDSIVSIQLVSRAKARGLVFSPRDVFERRSVAGLAAIASTTQSNVLVELPGRGVGDIPVLPVVRSMLEAGGGFARFQQSLVLDMPVGVTVAQVTDVITAVVTRHDVLRSRFRIVDGQEHWEAFPADTFDVTELIHHVVVDGDLSDVANVEFEAAVNRLDPAAGVMIQFVWLDSNPGRLLVVANHLVIDGVSWRILIPDLVKSGLAVAMGQRPDLGTVGTSVRRWAHALVDAAPNRAHELPIWESMRGTDPIIGSRAFDPTVDLSPTTDVVWAKLDAETSKALLTRVPEVFHGGVNDGLLAGLAIAVAVWRAHRGVTERSLLVQVEGHGREEQVVPGADLSHTVGWFTTVFPVRFDFVAVDPTRALDGSAPDLDLLVKTVKERLRSLPDNGIGYGLLRYLNADTAEVLAEIPRPQISFNYLGRVSTGEIPAEATGLGWLPSADQLGLTAAADADRPAAAVIDINAISAKDELRASFAFPTGLLSESDVTELADLWVRALGAIAAHAAKPGAGGWTPSDFALVQSKQSDIDTWTNQFGSISDVLPLTPLQSGLMFHHWMAGSGVDVYTPQLIITLSGSLGLERLHAAAQAVVDRHPNLRSAFVSDFGGHQVQVVSEQAPVPWETVDLSALPEAEREAAFGEFLAIDRTRGFDLRKPPLMRFAVVSLSESDHRLCITSHHLLFDGWSAPIILKELMIAYATRGDLSVLPRPRPFADFLKWISAQNVSASREAWAKALHGLREPAELASPGLHGSGLAQFEHVLSTDLTQAMNDTAQRLGVTTNTLFQCAWALTVGRLTGSSDVVFGATVSGRPADLNGVENMVGLFINTVPVRIRLRDDEQIGDFLRRTQAEQAELLEHHHLPLPEIAAAAGAPISFDTLIAFESYPIDRDGLESGASNIDGLELTGVESHNETHYPLTLGVDPGSKIRITASYLTSAFSAERIHELLTRFERVIGECVVGPEMAAGNVDLLAPDERAELLSRSGGAAVEPTLLSDLLVAAAKAHPNRVAVLDGSREVSYRELDEWSNRLARVLIKRGAGAEDVVAIGISRSLECVVAWWAVTKSGAAFVPVDPAYPADRIRHMLNDSGVRLGLCLDASRGFLPSHSTEWLPIDELNLTEESPAAITDSERVRPVRTSNTAYLIYTSGSTGLPKGVVVTHWGLANYSAEQGERYRVEMDSRILNLSSPSFDASMMELLMASAQGAMLVVSPADVYAGQPLADLIRERRVTHAFITPTVAASLPIGEGFGDLRMLTLGGEAVPADVIGKWSQADHRQVHVCYGPTETTIVSNISAPKRPDDVVTIGGPVRGMQALVLDARLRPVPVGATGELYLSGVQLTRGYHERRALTAERFVANPFQTGDRMYRTGDVVRWQLTDAGTYDLAYVGRSDFQIKIRGLRVELGEIEAVLTEYPGVESAIALGRKQPSGTSFVAAYVVMADGVDLSLNDLADYCASRLPAHMVPAAVVVLDAMPLTPVGKVDRRALPEPVIETTEFRAPVTDVEQAVAECVAEVLGIERVGLDDDFFLLGGNSLLAVTLRGKISDRLGSEMPLSWLFLNPTVMKLAVALETAGPISDEFGVLLPLRPSGDLPPLFCIHPAAGMGIMFSGLLTRLDPERPLYALQAPGIFEADFYPADLEEVAARYVSEIRRVWPDGPYHLLGWSLGGAIAHAMAVQLEAEGATVGTLISLDARPDVDPGRVDRLIREGLSAMGISLEPGENLSEMSQERAEHLFAILDAQSVSLSVDQLRNLFRSALHNAELLNAWEPLVYDGDLIYVIAGVVEDEAESVAEPRELWGQYVAGQIESVVVTAGHDQLMLTDAVEQWATQLEEWLS